MPQNSCKSSIYRRIYMITGNLLRAALIISNQGSACMTHWPGVGLESGKACGACIQLNVKSILRGSH